jgi:hypothetical protein
MQEKKRKKRTKNHGMIKNGKKSVRSIGMNNVLLAKEHIRIFRIHG